MLAKRIGEGEMYPSGYGFAYRDWARNQAVCYPLGLNWPAGLVRRAWIVVAQGAFRTPSATDLQLIHANIAGQSTGIAIGEERGRRIGYAEGHRIGRQFGQDETLQAFQAANTFAHRR